MPPRAYRRSGEGTATPDDLMALLVDRLVDYRAVVSTCPEEDLAEVIGGILGRHGADSVVVPADLPEAVLPAGVEVLLDHPGLGAAQLDTIDAVITTCALAIAETGTIVLDAGPGQGRRIVTLVPDLHVVVVRRHDVVRGVPEALARLEPAPRPLTWISGPSATSDIELSRVEGVHGPRRLEVVIVDPGTRHSSRVDREGPASASGT